MTDQLLRDALASLASRAEPAPDLAGRALRGAGRRRAGRLGLAAAAAAAAIVAPALLLHGPGRAPAGPALTPGAPDTSDYIAGCFRHGSPSGPMGDTRPRYGTVADYSVLVGQTVHQGETVAMIGNERGLVLCARHRGEGTEPPELRPWSGSVKNGMWSFDGPLRVDAIAYVWRVDEESGTGTHATGLHHVAVGRAKPEVARLVVTWNNGRVTEATLRNGYFMARVDSQIVKVSSNPKAAEPGQVSSPLTGTWAPADDRVLSFQPYTPDGTPLPPLTPPGRGVHKFSPADCPTAPSPLCP